MLFVTIASLVMLGLLDKAIRGGKFERERLQARFRLFELRDGLRLSAIRGQIAHDRWFDYLDTTITKTIDRIQDINIWESVALLAIYRNDESILNAQKKLDAALARPENQRLARIDMEYTYIIARLLMGRHYGFHYTLKSAAKVAGKVDNINRGLVTIFGKAPETSTLLEYA